MIDFTSKTQFGLEDLKELVTFLRSEQGCPWDRVQTHTSIRRNMLEEAYEACEAIDTDDEALMKEELGDVLLQVLFHADIEKDRGRMDLDSICDAECRKLIYRHPFLFGGGNSTWEEMKQKEKGQTTASSTLDAVARTLPAGWRAEKILKKAGKTGFSFASAEESLDKLTEETAELRRALQSGQGAEEELSDVLFAAAAVSAAMQRDPEEALHQACEKFIARFTAMEQSAAQEGLRLDELSRQQLLERWNACKTDAVNNIKNK